MCIRSVDLQPSSCLSEVAVSSLDNVSLPQLRGSKIQVFCRLLQSLSIESNGFFELFLSFSFAVDILMT